MKLTAAALDALKSPSVGQRKVFDGKGLYLLLSRTGARGWRLKAPTMAQGLPTKECLSQLAQRTNTSAADTPTGTAQVVPSELSGPPLPLPAASLPVNAWASHALLTPELRGFSACTRGLSAGSLEKYEFSRATHPENPYARIGLPKAGVALSLLNSNFSRMPSDAHGSPARILPGAQPPG